MRVPTGRYVECNDPDCLIDSHWRFDPLPEDQPKKEGLRVPTNAELEANAPDTVREAVRNWLKQHPRPFFGTDSLGLEKWLDWAAANFMNDPEIRGAWRKETNL